MKPGTYNLTAYRGAPFPFQFTFVDGDGQALDLSVYTDIKYNFFTLANQDNPEVSIDVTVSGNVVSGELSGAQTKEFYNSYYQGVFTRADGEDDYLMDGRLFITNVPGGAKEADAVVTVLAESGSVTVVGIVSVAEAIAAKIAAEGFRDEAAEFKITDAEFVGDDIVFTRSDGQTFSIVGGKTDITGEDIGEHRTLGIDDHDDVNVGNKTEGRGLLFDAQGNLAESSGPLSTEQYVDDKASLSVDEHKAEGVFDHDDVEVDTIQADSPDPLVDGGYRGDAQGNLLTTTQDIALVSVKLYADATQNVVIQLRNGHGASGTVLQEKSLSVNEGVNLVELNWTIPQGDTTIYADGTHTGLWRNNTGVDYPYITGGLSIVGGIGTSAFYYYFYDIQISQVAKGDLLQYDGEKWVDKDLDTVLSDRMDVAGGNENDLLQRESGVFVPKAPNLILQPASVFGKSIVNSIHFINDIHFYGPVSAPDSGQTPLSAIDDISFVYNVTINTVGSYDMSIMWRPLIVNTSTVSSYSAIAFIVDTDNYVVVRAGRASIVVDRKENGSFSNILTNTSLAPGLGASHTYLRTELVQGVASRDVTLYTSFGVLPLGFSSIIEQITKIGFSGLGAAIVEGNRITSVTGA